MASQGKTLILQTFRPQEPINQYVDSIQYISGNTKGTGFSKTAMSLIFNLRDFFKLYIDDSFTEFLNYKKYWLAGIQSGPVHVESYGDSEMIVIQFNTLGAHLFVEQPLHSFTDQYIPLDCIYSELAEDTWQQLMEAESIDQKFHVAQSFLSSVFKNKEYHKYQLLKHIANQIQSPDAHSISSICRENNISRKHLNNLFKTYIGISPKMLSSFHRLQSALQTLSQSRPARLNQIAYELEYFDQSHFNHDFKRLTGLKPTEYLNYAQANPSLQVVPHFIPFI